jgi:hypothetical protein
VFAARQQTIIFTYRCALCGARCVWRVNFRLMNYTFFLCLFIGIAVQSPAVTCGSTNAAFADGDVSGCFCRLSDATTVCVNGVWSVAQQSVLAQPLAQWIFNQNSSVVKDSSNDGFDAQLLDGFQFMNTGGTAFVRLNGTGYAIVNSISTVDFDMRAFTIEIAVRAQPDAADVVYMNLLT